MFLRNVVTHITDYTRCHNPDNHNMNDVDGFQALHIHNRVSRWLRIVGTTSFSLKDLKVYNDGTLVQILCFWILSIVLSLSKNIGLFILKKRFGNWILSPSSGKTYSVGPNRWSTH
jgi:hypothetical protein